MRVGPGLPVGQDVWSSRRTWATQDMVVPSSAHRDMLEGGKAARPLGRGGRGPRGFHQAASGSLPCSTQGLGPQCPPAWCRPTCDSEEGHRRHLGLGQGPRGRPGLGSENQAVQWAGSLHPSRLLVEVVGGGHLRVAVEAKSLFSKGGISRRLTRSAVRIFSRTNKRLLAPVRKPGQGGRQGRGCRERLPRAGGLRGRGGHRPAPWARTQRLPLSPLGRPCGRSPGWEISRHSACRVFVAGTLGG